jgi:hypothetical protein
MAITFSLSSVMRVKIQPKSIKRTHCSNSLVSLDTLEHLNHYQQNQCFQPNSTADNILLKKAKNNYFTKQLAKNLMCLDSPLNKAYRRTYYDCCTTIMQEGKKLTSKYCGARWCNVCNRIRTAKLLNGYTQPLSAINKPYFLTLTIPNVSANELKHTIVGMIRTSANIIRSIKRQKIAINGIRKLECTYNAESNKYNPHFHFIVDDYYSATLLQNKWLEHYPTATIKAQDIREINKDEFKELFKYQTKIVSKSKSGFNIYVPALDVIFNAMKNIRTFQSFGNIKKVNDDVEELIADHYKDVEYYEFAVWQWIENDWQNMADGKPLTNYKPSKRMQELVNEKMVT